MNFWFSEQERFIMEPFYKDIHHSLKNKQAYFRFFYDKTSLIVKYDTEADSDNDLDLDDPKYEDFFGTIFCYSKG